MDGAGEGRDSESKKSFLVGLPATTGWGSSNCLNSCIRASRASDFSATGGDTKLKKPDDSRGLETSEKIVVFGAESEDLNAELSASPLRLSFGRCDQKERRSSLSFLSSSPVNASARRTSLVAPDCWRCILSQKFSNGESFFFGRPSAS